VRILDGPADAGKGMGLFENIEGADSAEAFSRQIKTAAAEYYGTAAMAFIEKLATIRDGIGDMIAATTAEFLEEYVTDGADGQVLRGGRRFGLVAAAGELAIALGILPWPKGEAFAAAGVMYRAWVARRGGVGSAEERNILDHVKSFIEAHGESRFSPVVEPDQNFIRPTINRVGFFRSASVDEETVREYLVLPTAFNNELCAGFDKAHVTRVLKARGLLIPDKQGKSSQVASLPEFGKSRVYVIRLATAHAE
jgi:uncharacterized protein (DUF927 family)